MLSSAFVSPGIIMARVTVGVRILNRLVSFTEIEIAIILKIVIHEIRRQNWRLQTPD